MSLKHKTDIGQHWTMERGHMGGGKLWNQSCTENRLNNEYPQRFSGEVNFGKGDSIKGHRILHTQTAQPLKTWGSLPCRSDIPRVLYHSSAEYIKKGCFASSVHIRDRSNGNTLHNPRWPTQAVKQGELDCDTSGAPFHHFPPMVLPLGPLFLPESVQETVFDCTPFTSLGRKLYSSKHSDTKGGCKKVGRYVCNFCGRTCAKPSVLKKHVRSHTGERPYPCLVCGFSFKTKSNLYKHRKSHAHALRTQFSQEGNHGDNEPVVCDESDGGETTDSDGGISLKCEPKESIGRPPSISTELAQENQFHDSQHCVSESSALDMHRTDPKDELSNRFISRKDISLQKPILEESINGETLTLRSNSCTTYPSLTTAESFKGNLISSESLKDGCPEEATRQNLKKQQWTWAKQYYNQQQVDSRPFLLPSPFNSKGSTDSGYFSHSESTDSSAGRSLKSDHGFGSCLERMHCNYVSEDTGVGQKTGRITESMVCGSIQVDNKMNENSTTCMPVSSHKINMEAQPGDVDHRPQSDSLATDKVYQSCQERCDNVRLEQKSHDAENSLTNWVLPPRSLFAPHRALRRQKAFEVSVYTSDTIPSYSRQLSRIEIEKDTCSQESELARKTCDRCDLSTSLPSFLKNSTIPLKRRAGDYISDGKGQKESLCKKDSDIPSTIYCNSLKKEEDGEKVIPQRGFSLESCLNSNSASANEISVIQHSKTVAGPLLCLQRAHSDDLVFSSNSPQQGLKLEKTKSEELNLTAECSLKGEPHDEVLPKMHDSQQARPQRSLTVPEILVTDEVDSRPRTLLTSKGIKNEDFHWPKRSETLARFPAEKLPPKKKRLRLVELASLSAESGADSFISGSLSRSPSLESSYSCCSSQLTSIDLVEDNESRVKNKQGTELTMGSSLIGQAVMISHSREVIRSRSEQIESTRAAICRSSHTKSKSFDNGNTNKAPPILTNIGKGIYQHPKNCKYLSSTGDPLTKVFSTTSFCEVPAAYTWPKFPCLTLSRAPCGRTFGRVRHQHLRNTLRETVLPITTIPSVIPTETSGQTSNVRGNLLCLTCTKTTRLPPENVKCPASMHNTRHEYNFTNAYQRHHSHISPSFTETSQSHGCSIRAISTCSEKQSLHLQDSREYIKGLTQDEAQKEASSSFKGLESLKIDNFARKNHLDAFETSEMRLQSPRKPQMIIPTRLEGLVQPMFGQSIYTTAMSSWSAAANICKPVVITCCTLNSKNDSLDITAGVSNELRNTSVSPTADLLYSTGTCILSENDVFTPEKASPQPGKRTLPPSCCHDEKEPHPQPSQKRVKEESSEEQHQGEGLTKFYTQQTQTTISRTAESRKPRKKMLVRQMCTTECIDIQGDIEKEISIHQGFDESKNLISEPSNTSHGVKSTMGTERHSRPSTPCIELEIRRSTEDLLAKLPYLGSHIQPGLPEFGMDFVNVTTNTLSHATIPVLRLTTSIAFLQKMADSHGVPTTNDKNMITVFVSDMLHLSHILQPSLASSPATTWCLLYRRPTSAGSLNEALRLPSESPPLQVDTLTSTLRLRPQYVSTRHRLGQFFRSSADTRGVITPSKVCSLVQQSDVTLMHSEEPSVLLNSASRQIINNRKGSALGVITSDGRHTQRIRVFEGGYKTNEDYVYVRGRGRGKYVCEECGIRCRKPSMLRKHIRSHSDLRPFRCSSCCFAFKTKGNLTKHMKSKAHSKKYHDINPELVAGGSRDSEEKNEMLELITSQDDDHRFSDVEDTDGEMEEDVEDGEDEEEEADDDEEKDVGFVSDSGGFAESAEVVRPERVKVNILTTTSLLGNKTGCTEATKPERPAALLWPCCSTLPATNYMSSVQQALPHSNIIWPTKAFDKFTDHERVPRVRSNATPTLIRSQAAGCIKDVPSLPSSHQQTPTPTVSPTHQDNTAAMLPFKLVPALPPAELTACAAAPSFDRTSKYSLQYRRVHTSSIYNIGLHKETFASDAVVTKQ
uniref:transcription factor HIVEP2-like n=1 Tax=Myxine glutinosa TaxID=7769 RepID=UPI00358F517F